ncbi:MAG: hypothetical protein ACD_2C00164G0005 [uncultured bacterium (gcode 4)]|uniref:NIF system FeS cluster assembly NifU N-terminal domain-containing protein n=1 Tax=uncultured bacterium (gcode 4) TaxID=1234023 RepID=K2GGE4_9BACT|nr:MAG: hypothetical protein ACD_2C00164G0005 [uncultured bacterium (gcode 4)]
MSEGIELITEYAKNPSNKYEMENFDIVHNEESRVCWDTVMVFLKIEWGKIADFSFTWNTSIITTASASIFWESIIGMEISEILDLNIEYIVSLIWAVSPKRKHAATLAILATRNAIHKYLKDWITDDFSDVLE